ncbi:MAG: guanylate kinase [Actinobacteria bacterium]|uniref:Guanylate kinase n=1 Tax=Candidatus Fonsibacter lacus TaxID=2576439 RepID=A0A965LKQ3_9PROT|nr:guanylate kinase [Candidatus Fonsibacter lacus]
MELIVLSGPGGVGKSTVSDYLRKNSSDIWVSVSATTRAPRAGEIDGVDYFFRTEHNFKEQIARGDFLEWAHFAGNYYGTPKEPVSEKISSGKSVLLEIEISGAKQVRAASERAYLVFLAPPSISELERRLLGRGTESPERAAQRLEIAREEMAQSHWFDEVLVNTSVEEVAARLITLASQPG